MPKKVRQKFKYFENEESFWDEIKSIFHHFWRGIIEAIKTKNKNKNKKLKKFFFRGWESDFKSTLTEDVLN